VALRPEHVAKFASDYLALNLIATVQSLQTGLTLSEQSSEVFATRRRRRPAASDLTYLRSVSAFTIVFHAFGAIRLHLVENCV
jgi:hypothetical protein